MEKSEETYHALRKELEKQILEKIKQVETKVLTHNTSPNENLQILISVNDELDDVLLNWQSNNIGPLSFDLDED